MKISNDALAKIIASTAVSVTFGIISIYQGVKTRHAIKQQIHNTIISEEYKMLEEKVKTVEELTEQINKQKEN